MSFLYDYRATRFYVLDYMFDFQKTSFSTIVDELLIEKKNNYYYTK